MTQPSPWTDRLAQVDPSRRSATPKGPPPAPVFAPATFWTRAAAWWLDFLPFQVLCLLWPAPGGDLAGAPGQADPMALLSQQLAHVATMCMLVTLGWAAWNIAWEAWAGTTPGKWLLGLAVVRTTAPPSLSADPTRVKGVKLAPLGVWSAFRFLAAGLSWLTLNLGHSMASWRTDRAALHDLVSGTAVVVVPPAARIPVGFQGHASSTEMRQKGWILVWGSLAVVTLWIIIMTVQAVAHAAQGLPLQ